MRTDTARAVHTILRTPEVGGPESWELQVHCRGPLAWMWDDSLDGEFESPQARRARHRKAAQVCATCPARSACAAAATQTTRAEGIWAGTLIGGSRPLMVPGRPCLRCERPLLPGKSHKPLPAGWVRHSAHGYCHPCLKRHYRNGAPA